MCPDPQLFSIYMDEELPSPWKEKLETHLEQCPGCAEKIEIFRRQRLLVKEAGAESSEENALMEKAKERIWRNLEAKHRMSRNNLWRRRLSIPLPAAAAAAAVIAFLAVMLFRGSPDRSGGLASQPVDPVSRASFALIAEEESGIIPMTDLNSVLQYLGADGSDIIILQLPESKSFLRSGDPAIIRAADYTRRNP
jgi:hypothetical protein